MNSTLFRRVVPNLVLLALAGFGYVEAGHFDAGADATRVGPDLWPRIVCIVLALTSLIGLVAGLTEGPELPAESDEAAAGIPVVPETHPQLVWIGVITTGIYVAALPELGFLCATFLYAMALLVTGGMRRWALVPVAGAILAIVFTVIFMKIVYVALPLGEGPFKDVSLFAFRLLAIH